MSSNFVIAVIHHCHKPSDLIYLYYSSKTCHIAASVDRQEVPGSSSSAQPGWPLGGRLAGQSVSEGVPQGVLSCAAGEIT
jgi:hypothetical protein